MKGRLGFSRSVKREFWRLIVAGEATYRAGELLGVGSRTAGVWFRQAGGVPPLSLKPLSGRYLSMTEREEIAVLHGHVSQAEIARRLGRSRSTVCRELARNSPTHRGGHYRATSAQAKTEDRALRPKVTKLAGSDRLLTYVLANLTSKERWSPEQIAARMVVDFPHDEHMRISHEAIYKALYVQGRGALGREVTRCLRSGRAKRYPHRQRQARRGRGIAPELMISARPAEVTDRAVPGHWEGDLITGILNKSAIGTLVERTTRFTMLLHLPGDHGAEAVRDAIAATILTLPASMRGSLTWDQGNELSRHAEITIATDLDIFFCDPHSPWQRGTNENTNGLLRQYFPKSTNLAVHDAAELQSVADALNGRPRKTLGWATPTEAMAKLLSLTA